MAAGAGSRMASEPSADRKGAKCTGVRAVPSVATAKLRQGKRFSAAGCGLRSGEAPVFPQHLRAFLGRRRSREMIALNLVAAVCGEQLELLARFHALGHYFQLQAVREGDDRQRD